MFLVGFRKQPADTQVTERVGAVVIKRTYTVDGVTGALTPAAAPLPIFVTDQIQGAAVVYEHDLAAFKPQGDLIVVGFVQQLVPHEVRVDDSAWLSRTPIVGDALLFGWEPRTNDPHPKRRQDEAGGFSDDADDYPLEWPVTNPDRDPLPGGVGDPRTPPFRNRFYNGYLRKAAVAAPFPYLPPAATVKIARNAVVVYRLQLAGEAIHARYLYYTGRGADEDCGWRARSIGVNLDTLVVEPDLSRCYVVWRGVWDFDEQPAEAYRRLVVVAA